MEISSEDSSSEYEGMNISNTQKRTFVRSVPSAPTMKLSPGASFNRFTNTKVSKNKSEEAARSHFSQHAGTKTKSTKNVSEYKVVGNDNNITYVYVNNDQNKRKRRVQTLIKKVEKPSTVVRPEKVDKIQSGSGRKMSWRASDELELNEHLNLDSSINIRRVNAVASTSKAYKQKVATEYLKSLKGVHVLNRSIPKISKLPEIRPKPIIKERQLPLRIEEDIEAQISKNYIAKNIQPTKIPINATTTFSEISKSKTSKPSKPKLIKIDKSKLIPISAINKVVKSPEKSKPKVEILEHLTFRLKPPVKKTSFIKTPKCPENFKFTIEKPQQKVIETITSQNIFEEKLDNKLSLDLEIALENDIIIFDGDNDVNAANIEVPSDAGISKGNTLLVFPDENTDDNLVLGLDGVILAQTDNNNTTNEVDMPNTLNQANIKKPQKQHDNELLDTQEDNLEIQNEDLKVQNEDLEVQNENFEVQNDDLDVQNEESLVQNEESLVQNDDLRVQEEDLGVQNEDEEVQTENLEVEDTEVLNDQQNEVENIELLDNQEASLISLDETTEGDIKDGSIDSDNLVLNLDDIDENRILVQEDEDGNKFLILMQPEDDLVFVNKEDENVGEIQCETNDEELVLQEAENVEQIQLDENIHEVSVGEVSQEESNEEVPLKNEEIQCEDNIHDVSMGEINQEESNEEVHLTNEEVQLEENISDMSVSEVNQEEVYEEVTLKNEECLEEEVKVPNTEMLEEVSTIIEESINDERTEVVSEEIHSEFDSAKDQSIDENSVSSSELSDSEDTADNNSMEDEDTQVSADTEERSNNPEENPEVNLDTTEGSLEEEESSELTESFETVGGDDISSSETEDEVLQIKVPNPENNKTPEEKSSNIVPQPGLKPDEVSVEEDEEEIPSPLYEEITKSEISESLSITNGFSGFSLDNLKMEKKSRALNMKKISEDIDKLKVLWNLNCNKLTIFKYDKSNLGKQNDTLLSQIVASNEDTTTTRHGNTKDNTYKSKEEYSLKVAQNIYSDDVLNNSNKLIMKTSEQEIMKTANCDESVHKYVEENTTLDQMLNNSDVQNRVPVASPKKKTKKKLSNQDVNSDSINIRRSLRNNKETPKQEETQKTFEPEGKQETTKQEDNQEIIKQLENLEDKTEILKHLENLEDKTEIYVKPSNDVLPKETKEDFEISNVSLSPRKSLRHSKDKPEALTSESFAELSIKYNKKIRGRKKSSINVPPENKVQESHDDKPEKEDNESLDLKSNIPNEESNEKQEETKKTRVLRSTVEEKHEELSKEKERKNSSASDQSQIQEKTIKDRRSLRSNKETIESQSEEMKVPEKLDLINESLTNEKQGIRGRKRSITTKSSTEDKPENKLLGETIDKEVNTNKDKTNLKSNPDNEDQRGRRKSPTKPMVLLGETTDKEVITNIGKMALKSDPNNENQRGRRKTPTKPMVLLGETTDKEVITNKGNMTLKSDPDNENQVTKGRKRSITSKSSYVKAENKLLEETNDKEVITSKGKMTLESDPDNENQIIKGRKRSIALKSSEVKAENKLLEETTNKEVITIKGKMILKSDTDNGERKGRRKSATKPIVLSTVSETQGKTRKSLRNNKQAEDAPEIKPLEEQINSSVLEDVITDDSMQQNEKKTEIKKNRKSLRFHVPEEDPSKNLLKKEDIKANAVISIKTDVDNNAESTIIGSTNRRNLRSYKEEEKTNSNEGLKEENLNLVEFVEENKSELKAKKSRKSLRLLKDSGDKMDEKSSPMSRRNLRSQTDPNLLNNEIFKEMNSERKNLRSQSEIAISNEESKNPQKSPKIERRGRKKANYKFVEPIKTIEEQSTSGIITEVVVKIPLPLIDDSTKIKRNPKPDNSLINEIPELAISNENISLNVENLSEVKTKSENNRSSRKSSKDETKNRRENSSKDFDKNKLLTTSLLEDDDIEVEKAVLENKPKEYDITVQDSIVSSASPVLESNFSPKRAKKINQNDDLIEVSNKIKTRKSLRCLKTSDVEEVKTTSNKRKSTSVLPEMELRKKRLKDESNVSSDSDDDNQVLSSYKKNMLKETKRQPRVRLSRLTKELESLYPSYEVPNATVALPNRNTKLVDQSPKTNNIIRRSLRNAAEVKTNETIVSNKRITTLITASDTLGDIMNDVELIRKSLKQNDDEQNEANTKEPEISPVKSSKTSNNKKLKSKKQPETKIHEKVETAEEELNKITTRKTPKVQSKNIPSENIELSRTNPALKTYERKKKTQPIKTEPEIEAIFDLKNVKVEKVDDDVRPIKKENTVEKSVKITETTHEPMVPIKIEKDTPTSTRTPTPMKIDENIKLKTANESTLPIVLDNYDDGDLVYARLGNYPFWPCLISREPRLQVIKRSCLKDGARSWAMFHVRFFGDRGRRSWIHAKRIMPLNDINDLSSMHEKLKEEGLSLQPYIITKTFKKAWNIGMEEALSLKDKTVEERYDFFFNAFASKREKQQRAKREEKKSLNFYNSLEKIEKKLNIGKRRVSKEKVKAEPASNLQEEKVSSSESGTSSPVIPPPRTPKRSLFSKYEAKLPDTKAPAKLFKTKAEVKQYVKDSNLSQNELSLNEEELKPDPKLRKSESRTDISETGTSDTESFSKFNLSSPIILTADMQKDLYKRNLTFFNKSMNVNRVCQICLKPGDIFKCRGKCCGYFHYFCIGNECHEESMKVESRAEDRMSPVDDRVSIIEIGDDYDPPPICIRTDEAFQKLPLGDKIDELLKQVMDPILKTTSYDFESSPARVTIKEEPEDEEPKLLIHHVTGDDVIVIKKDFKCKKCSQDIKPECFGCGKDVSPKNTSIRSRCNVSGCGKFYHLDCLKAWPQTQYHLGQMRQDENDSSAFTCPLHVCHTCVSDEPRRSTPLIASAKIFRCLKCPATYHNSINCIPAGTDVLSSTQIICPRHTGIKIKGKIKKLVKNTTWCFICNQGGNLVCCDNCPTSIHAECAQLEIKQEDSFICDDCESGRLPLYDEIVWVKRGNSRWWPALILLPHEIPKDVQDKSHMKGEFVVEYYGTHECIWVGSGRVFLFQEGDKGELQTPKKKKDVDFAFDRAIEEAVAAHAIKREFKIKLKENIKADNKPPPYKKIKFNRPVGNVKVFDGNVSLTNPCSCSPLDKHPCGYDSDCLNRLLMTECDPKTCPAGDCENQCFEKREYPSMEPYKTVGRGWGLKTLEFIKKGQFIIEYVGEVIDDLEYQRRIEKMHEQKDDNYYFLTIDTNRMIDAGPKGNLSRFMNHCCKPNCGTQKWTVKGDTRVGLFALEDIPKNTELTFNYNLQCIGEDKKTCHCGAELCTGFLGAKHVDEKKAKKQMDKSKSKKKSLITLVTIEPCFICGKSEEPTYECSNKMCSKFYHLNCIGLNCKPESKWSCPWHNCTTCNKRTIRCCTKCLNSYCPSHSEGNIRYDKLLGYVCYEHDPTKESQESLSQSIISTTSESNISTGEGDITSTTVDDMVKKSPVQKPDKVENPKKRKRHSQQLEKPTKMLKSSITAKK